MVKGLTVCSVVERDDGLLSLMIRSVCAFTNPLPNFIICDNTNGKNHDRIHKSNVANANITIINNSPNLIGGSNRHGLGLNKIFPLVTTEYTAILDSDTAILHKDWCNVGSGYCAKGAEKTQNVFHMCFFIFKTDVLMKHTAKAMDFRAGRDDKDRKNNKNYIINCDVGWQLGQYIDRATVEKLKFIDCKSDNSLFKGMQCDKFLSETGILLASHLGRGSSMKSKRNLVSKGFEHPTDQLIVWKKIINDRIIEKK